MQRNFVIIGCCMTCLKSGTAVIAGLKEKFDDAVRRNDVKAIVLTGKVD